MQQLDKSVAKGQFAPYKCMQRTCKPLRALQALIRGVMTKTKVHPIGRFFTSLGVGILLLLSICYYLEDFSPRKIAEVMFWAGGLLLVAGGSIFFPYNPYAGQTLASTTQLRKNPNGKGPERSDRETTERFIRGMSIAAPGIVMMGVSYFLGVIS